MPRESSPFHFATYRLSLNRNQLFSKRKIIYQFLAGKYKSDSNCRLRPIKLSVPSSVEQPRRAIRTYSARYYFLANSLRLV